MSSRARYQSYGPCPSLPDTGGAPTPVCHDEVGCCDRLGWPNHLCSRPRRIGAQFCQRIHLDLFLAKCYGQPRLWDVGLAAGYGTCACGPLAPSYHAALPLFPFLPLLPSSLLAALLFLPSSLLLSLCPHLACHSPAERDRLFKHGWRCALWACQGPLLVRGLSTHSTLCDQHSVGCRHGLKVLAKRTPCRCESHLHTPHPSEGLAGLEAAWLLFLGI